MTGRETPSGLFNFRDVGGMPCLDGRVVRSQVLYRSAALDTLADPGLARLKACQIRRVVDLRTDTEREQAPDRSLPGSKTTTVPILEGAVGDLADTLARLGARDPADAQRMLAGLPSLAQLYVAMLSHAGKRIVEAARVIMTGEGAALVHCTAGKDRTGVVVATLLTAVGADPDAVAADYSASAGELEPEWAPWMRRVLSGMGVPAVPAVAGLLTSSPAEAIRQAVAWLDARSGGAGAYLRHNGLTVDELESLHARLTSRH